MNKQSHFVFLPTNERSPICLMEDKMHFLPSRTDINNQLYKNHFLYILSDDEIKENEWVVFAGQLHFIIEVRNHILETKNDVQLLAENCKKIIATTNPELWGVTDNFEYEKVAKISQPDIEHCISLHNGKGGEADVDVLARKDTPHSIGQVGFKRGYNQCLKDNADKKFTLDEAERIFNYAYELPVLPVSQVRPIFKQFIESILKLEPKSDIVLVEYELASKRIDNEKERFIPNSNFYQPKLDKDGNIIIVR